MTEQQVLKLRAIFYALLQDDGVTTVDRVMSLNPLLFSSKNDVVKYLQDFKKLGLWYDTGESPSLWRWTKAGKAQAEEIQRAGVTGSSSNTG